MEIFGRHRLTWHRPKNLHRRRPAEKQILTPIYWQSTIPTIGQPRVLIMPRANMLVIEQKGMHVTTHIMKDACHDLELN